MHWKLLGESVDPVTGDKLSAGERVSWMIQRVIRRWAFIGVLQLITAACFVWGVRNPDVLVWWNLGASDFAIIMEFLVGMAFFGQGLRDAVVSRAVERMERAHGEQLASLLSEVGALRAEVGALRGERAGKANSTSVMSAPTERSGGTRASDGRSAVRGKPRSGPSGKVA
jgi:hypothetical protein